MDQPDWFGARVVGKELSRAFWPSDISAGLGRLGGVDASVAASQTVNQRSSLKFHHRCPSLLEGRGPRGQRLLIVTGLGIASRLYGISDGTGDPQLYFMSCWRR